MNINNQPTTAKGTLRITGPERSIHSMIYIIKQHLDLMDDKPITLTEDAKFTHNRLDQNEFIKKHDFLDLSETKPLKFEGFVMDSFKESLEKLIPTLDLLTGYTEDDIRPIVERKSPKKLTKTELEDTVAQKVTAHKHLLHELMYIENHPVVLSFTYTETNMKNKTITKEITHLFWEKHNLPNVKTHLELQNPLGFDAKNLTALTGTKHYDLSPQSVEEALADASDSMVRKEVKESITRKGLQKIQDTLKQEIAALSKNVDPKDIEIYTEPKQWLASETVNKAIAEAVKKTTPITPTKK